MRLQRKNIKFIITNLLLSLHCHSFIIQSINHHFHLSINHLASSSNFLPPIKKYRITSSEPGFISLKSFFKTWQAVGRATSAINRIVGKKEIGVWLGRGENAITFLCTSTIFIFRSWRVPSYITFPHQPPIIHSAPSIHLGRVIGYQTTKHSTEYVKEGRRPDRESRRACSLL